MQLAAEMTGNYVAAYWDIENIHWGLSADDNRHRCYGKQSPLINFAAAAHFLRPLGTVLIHRAYADWGNFSCYRSDIFKYVIDPVHIFSGTNALKNGADIRLVVDALEDTRRAEQISHLVIFAGDSDFVPLAQQARQSGRTVTGIAVRGSTSKRWESSCSMFVDYDTMIKEWSRFNGSSPESAKLPEDRRPTIIQAELSRARDLIAGALRDASSDIGNAWVSLSLVGTYLVKRDSTFRPTNFGYQSLSKLLKAFTNMVEFREIGGGTLVRLVA